MTKVETELNQYNNYQGYTLRIPEEARCLFPADEEHFIIKANIDDYDVYVTTPPSHPRPHIHIPKKWVEASPRELRPKDKVVIEVTESHGGKIYHFA